MLVRHVRHDINMINATFTDIPHGHRWTSPEISNMSKAAIKNHI